MQISNKTRKQIKNLIDTCSKTNKKITAEDIYSLAIFNIFDNLAVVKELK